VVNLILRCKKIGLSELRGYHGDNRIQSDCVNVGKLENKDGLEGGW
jgi:hypothetical protein